MSAQDPQLTRRLGMAGYIAKGVAYAIAGAADRGRRGQLRPGEGPRPRRRAAHPGRSSRTAPWLLALMALGIAAFGVYCFFQARYRKV